MIVILFQDLYHDPHVLSTDPSITSLAIIQLALEIYGIQIPFMGGIESPSAWFKAGLYKVPCNLIFFPLHIFKILICFSKISIPFLSSLLDTLSKSKDIIGKMILFPFFHVIFFHTAMLFPYPHHNLIFFPNQHDEPPRPRGDKELYPPLCLRC